MALVEMTAGAIATLVLTKAFERTGTVLADKTIEQGGKLIQLLKSKSPDTASAIEQVRQNPQLVEQQPEDYGEAVLIEKVESAAKSDAEIEKEVQALADGVKSQPSTVKNLTKLAEKIGLVIQGGNVNINEVKF